jgi:RimJ/RimL family protein N-acetyltransferase
MELTDGFIVLRPHLLSEAKRLHEAVQESLNELMPWMTWCHEGYAIEETREFLARCVDGWREGREYNFSINEPQSGLFLGGCDLNRIGRDGGTANLGYWVRIGQTGRGVATAAARLLARFGFSELKLNRIEISVAVGNKASRRVAAKAGAVREGVLRNKITVRDTVQDGVMFSLIPQDFA